jgi:hypothetical protein
LHLTRELFFEPGELTQRSPTARPTSSGIPPQDYSHSERYGQES